MLNLTYMVDIKDNLAKNLATCRKAFGLTQAELAEKLNYSDKAVSKWERGESVPDLVVLKQLADFYGVTIDKLISENKNIRPNVIKNLGKRRIFTLLFSLGIVWIVAVLMHTLLAILNIPFRAKWLMYIYALPISSIILTIFTSIWKLEYFKATSISFIVWTVILALFLTFINVLSPVPSNLWLIFLIGIPAQSVIIFIFVLRYLKRSR